MASAACIPAATVSPRESSGPAAAGSAGPSVSSTASTASRVAVAQPTIDGVAAAVVSRSNSSSSRSGVGQPGLMAAWASGVVSTVAAKLRASRGSPHRRLRSRSPTDRPESRRPLPAVTDSPRVSARRSLSRSINRGPACGRSGSAAVTSIQFTLSGSAHAAPGRGAGIAAGGAPNLSGGVSAPTRPTEPAQRASAKNSSLRRTVLWRVFPIDR